MSSQNRGNTRSDFAVRSLWRLRPSFSLFGRSWPFYGLFVWSGIFAGILFAISLSLASDVPLEATAGVIAAGLLAAGALAWGTQIFSGREMYTFYHYQLVVLVAGGGVLALMHRPVLPVLDLMGPMLGLVQAFGRLGCFMAGCCHGRPYRWGVRYGQVHAEHGFAQELVGVRLFPIQAVESLCLFAIAASGAALVLSGASAGSALATYLVGYATIRFALEFARGDDARPHVFGFSEAQWTAVIVVSATAAAEIAGVLPFVPWHLALVAAAGLTALAVAVYRRFTPSYTLFRPGHVSEIARVLDALAGSPSSAGQLPRVARTSLGLGLSVGNLHHDRMHYALSSREGALSEATAKRLAALILSLRHTPASSQLLPGGHGVFHVLIERPR
jgi:Prolipoprotein diacylglyceryl transferase